MEFKKGDTVKLKSGSLLMTVSDVDKYDYEDRDQVKCVWFKGTEKCEALFEIEVLKKADTDVKFHGVYM